LQKGGKYFYSRNGSALVAFTIGKSMNFKNTSFKIIGAHTDSPNLRFAPNSYLESSKYDKFNLQTYGGGLWQTWFDRDLSIAGKIVFKDLETGKLSSKLVKVDHPILRIPHLAIHLSSDRNKFEWNNETHLKAVLSTTFFDDKNSKEDENLPEQQKVIHKKLGKKLSNLISKTIQIKTEQIIDYDLALYDCQESCLLGIDEEFISSGRLDNLGSSFTSLHALINTVPEVEIQSSINFIALFDNEETGSLSFQGADSEFFGNNLLKIFTTIEKSENETSTYDEFLSCCARSFVISADMAHGVHPNYGEKHQSEHRPYIHGGVTIKINPQNRYATDSEGAALIKEIAKKADVPIQEFIVRQDSPCGTTIGPIISGKLGIKTVDVGIPQLAMHSIRELCGVVDLYYYRKFFEQFFLSEIDKL
jgi:aspartyl aminopeptidase